MKWRRIRVVANDGTVIFNDTVDQLPIKEEVIKSLSIQRYHEPDPCIIYRTCITRKIYIDLLEHLMEIGKGKQIPCSMLGDIVFKVNLKLDDGTMELI